MNKEQTGHVNHVVNDEAESQNIVHQNQEETKTTWMLNPKVLSFVTLVIQNTALVLVMKCSRLNTDTPYLSSSVVVMSEILKFMIASWLFYRRLKKDPSAISTRQTESTRGPTLNEDSDLTSSQTDDAQEHQIPTYQTLPRHITLSDWIASVFGNPTEVLQMLVPSGLYTIQNILQFTAINYLDAPTYQVTSQLKILTTAMFTVLILHRRITLLKWVSLILLTMGVTMVHYHTPDSQQQHEERDEVSTAPSPAFAKSMIGLMAMLGASVLSGMAGVYFEKFLKGSKTSVWQRNIHLSMFGVVLGTVFGVVLKDGNAVLRDGFFQGYNVYTIGAIILQSVGGIIVAIVIKYSDNIIKGFATSISMASSTLLSAVFLGTTITPSFVTGATFVVLASYLYGKPTAKPPKNATPPVDREATTLLINKKQGKE